MHITGCKYVFHGSFVLARSRCHIGSCIDIDFEIFRHIILTSQESCRNQNQFHLYGIFTSRDLHHGHPTGLFVFLAFQFYQNCLADISFLIFDKFFDGCGIYSRILSEDCDCFLLTIICLADSRPFRPRIIFRTFIRCLRHHFQLKYRFGTMSHGSSHAVVSGIATTDDHYIFSFCGNVGAVL